MGGCFTYINGQFIPDDNTLNKAAEAAYNTAISKILDEMAAKTFKIDGAITGSFNLTQKEHNPMIDLGPPTKEKKVHYIQIVNNDPHYHYFDIGSICTTDLKKNSDQQITAFHGSKSQVLEDKHFVVLTDPTEDQKAQAAKGKTEMTPPKYPTINLWRVKANTMSHHFEIGEVLIGIDVPPPSGVSDIRALSLDHPTNYNWVSVPKDVTLIPRESAEWNALYKTLLPLYKMYHGEDITLAKPLYATLDKANPQTQKAKGIKALLDLTLPGLSRPNKMLWIGPKADVSTIPLYPYSLSFPLMARPCPIKPRHGFVESRIVKDKAELQAIHAETLAADPKGELLLTRFNPAEYSAVVTNSSITVGSKNDGATSGRDGVMIPCTSDIEGYTKKWSPRTTVGGTPVNRLKYIGLTKSNALYMEMVGDMVVQLRTGPNVDTGQKTWAPCTCMRIDQILTLTPELEKDFLAYEKYLDGIDKGNTVIYLPTASLASHHAVQAITRGIAVITGDAPEPVLGQLYSFEANTVPAYDTATLRQAITTGVVFAQSKGISIRTDQSVPAWAVACIQGMAIQREIPNITCIAAASLLLSKLGTAICLGEHRHFFDRGPGFKLPHFPIGPVGSDLNLYAKYRYAVGTHDDDKDAAASFNREYHYNAVLEQDWTDPNVWNTMISNLARAAHDYSLPGWYSGYGGNAWVDCTKATLDLVCATYYLVQRQVGYPICNDFKEREVTLMLLNKCIEAANRFITVCHNGGKCLTKVINGDTLNLISRGIVGPFLSHFYTKELFIHDTPQPTTKPKRKYVRKSKPKSASVKWQGITFDEPVIHTESV